MAMGLPCDSDGYDLRIEQCRICGSRGCTKKHSCGAMTAPRDDIAGLRKWNDEWPHWQFTEHQHDALRLVLDHFEEAATQLDALSARVKELEAEVEAMYTSLDANWTAHQRVVAAESRATRLQQERDEAYERAAKVAERFGEPYALNTNTGAMMFRAQVSKIADAIRQLAAGNEKEGEDA